MNDENVEIIIVEDNPSDAELLLRVFRKHKLANDIVLLKDGAQALDYFLQGDPVRRSRPRVVILDLKLPKVSGIQILKQIKSDERTRTIPVVVLTSSQEERDIVESYKLGVNSYIVKPVDFEQFVEAVRQLGLYWLLLNQAPTFK